MKHTLLTLLTALLLAPLGALGATGQWTTYQIFGTAVDEVIEMPQKVYFTSLGNLYSYSPSDNETYHYSIANKLNGSKISKVFGDPQHQCVVIVYDDANMDALYDNGRVVNMPQIKDATLYTSKTVNDITFSGDRMYVAAGFGIVVYDATNHEVVESGIYNTNIKSAAPVGDYLVIYQDGAGLKYAPLTSTHNQLSRFKAVERSIDPRVMPVSGGKFLTVDYWAKGKEYPTLVEYDFTTGKIASTQAYEQTPLTSPSNFRNNGQYIYIQDAKNLVVFDHDGQYVKTIPLTGELASNRVAPNRALDQVWAGSPDGVARYDVASSPATALMSRVKPYAMTCQDIAFIKPDPKGGVNVSNVGQTRFLLGISNEKDNVLTANRVDGATIEEIAPHTPLETEVAGRVNENKKYKGIHTPSGTAADPDVPGRYFVATSYDGIVVIRDGEYEGQYCLNAPFKTPWGGTRRMTGVIIDRQGNLWTAERPDAGNSVYLLPAAKRRLPPSQTQASDWIKLCNATDLGLNFDIYPLQPKGKSYMLIAGPPWSDGIAYYDHKNTPEDTSDDVFRLVSSFVDQDGKTVDMSNMVPYCLTEDQNGQIWVGTSSGVFVIPDPDRVFDAVPQFNRVKVPRNDGTPYADYLLDAVKVYDITTDPSNRKWIATANSGLYLVSPNGDEIIDNFLPSNSPLPQSTVWSVYADPQSNRVYVGTSDGLLAYQSDSAPAASSFDNAYAYPNPVRPDYTGPVTIKNLMDDSLVKITDARGNLVAQTRSEGGLATWDLLNLNGQPVPSGVYYVMVSNGPNASSPTGAACKVTVIR